jgi:predicted nucleic acid-binding Zn ribbon protein
VRENVQIITGNYVRDESIERRIIEHNRERMASVMLLFGAVLLLLAVMY